jgi:2-oxoglutarate ferredoxin oxidoreductase subunit alpha
MTVEAFNLAERYRVPVMLMMDECVGHMTEKVVIPPAGQLMIEPRRYASKPPGEFNLYETGEDLVPEMAHAGDGYNVFVTGLTHDERGYPQMNPKAQRKLVNRLFEKIRRASDALVNVESEELDGADVVVVSYGITARVAQRAIQQARDKGLRVGKLRLKTVWPFPEKLIRELAGKVKALVMPELNMGQVVLELERCAAGQCKVISVPHPGGTVHNPAEILEAIEEGRA